VQEPEPMDHTDVPTSDVPPPIYETSDASEALEAPLDKTEPEDQSFAEIFRQNESTIAPPTEAPSSESASDVMEIDSKEEAHVLIEPTPAPTISTIAQAPTPASPPKLYGTLRCKHIFPLSPLDIPQLVTYHHTVADPKLRWQSGSSVFEIKKRTIVLGTVYRNLIRSQFKCLKFRRVISCRANEIYGI